ncbi:MAG: cytidylate kinase [Maribacter sp.]
MNKITIAIDGYSSCGKSTLAKSLAKELGYIYVDTGAMYRSATLYFIRNEVALDNEEQIAEALDNITISFQVNPDKSCNTILNGENVEEEIRGMEVSNMVSPVATVSAVRKAMVAQQRKMGENKGVVMDGRDIGTVVFPYAELKIFLNADTEIRAKRRLDEMHAKGIEIKFQEIKKNLRDRDRIDSTRKDSPLRKAFDAIEIDNTDMSRENQLEHVLDLANRIIKVSQNSV